MAEEKKSIFREKRLTAIESPESFNDYLKVTSPGIFLVLITVLVFLAGAVIWGFFGHFDATVKAAVISENGQGICYVPKGVLESVLENKAVTVDGKKYALKVTSLREKRLTEEEDLAILLAGDYDAGDKVYPVLLEEVPPEGIYTGSIVTESVTPISFLIN